MDRIPPIVPVLRRNALNAALAFFSVIGASFLYLRITPSVYEGSTRLILDERRISVSDLGQALATTPTAGNSNPIATQAEVVTSEKVLKRAVTLLRKDPAPKGLGTIGGMNESIIPKKGAAKQELVDVGLIASTLRVKIVPATSILELTYRNSDPVLVTWVLNAVANAVVQESEEAIRQQASSVRTFLESRIPQQQANLDRAALAESQFKERNGIVALEAQDNSLVTSLTQVEDQIRTLNAQINETERKSQLLKGIIGAKGVEDAYLASRAGQDDELKTLRAKLTEFEAQVAESRARFTDENPEVIALIQKRDELRAAYTKSLQRIVPTRNAVADRDIAADELSRTLIANYITGEVERRALINRMKALTVQEQQLRVRLTELPSKQRILASLTRQREEEASKLRLLQTKLEEARIAEAQLVSNVRVAGLASVPSSPSSPKRVLVMLLGTATGLALAVVVILLGELLNRRLGVPSEVESQLKLPVLAELPRHQPILHTEHISHFLNDPQSIEPYRRLLKTLELKTENQLKSIVISSSIQGDGKSDLSTRLALVAALLSRRTLLIDADLSHPLQHQYFNLPSQPGLTDIVRDNAALFSVVQNTSLDHLDVLTHGRWTSRPAQVLESESMKDLIANATTHYDLVIIDASPISQYADAMTLNEYTDGMVLVVRPDFTPKDIALQTIADLHRANSSILGLVVSSTPDPFNKAESRQYREISEDSVIDVLPNQDKDATVIRADIKRIFEKSGEEHRN
jgi:polysaccharide biosynthesis transport protein